MTNYYETFKQWVTGDVFQTYGWIGSVFTIVLVTMIISLIEKIVFKKVYEKFQKTKNIWDESLLKASHAPILLLIWIVGITIAAEVVAKTVPKSVLFEYIDTVRKLGVIFTFGWFLVRLVKQIELNILKPRKGKKDYDKTMVTAVSQLIRISFIITIALVAAQSVGFSISGVLAFGGIGGLAIGLAAKDLLANFFGGLMIYMDRPFKVGDWIRSPDKTIEGTVEDIGWRLTRIRTFDKRPLYVPNAIFSTIAVENASRMHNRRIKTTVGVRYDDAGKIASITKDIKDMLLNHPEIDTKQTCIVNLINFGPSALDILLYTFTKTVNWIEFQEIQQEVFLKIIDIIEGYGAECAFPTQTLHITGEAIGGLITEAAK